MSLVEDTIKIQVSQVVTGLINKNFNVIIVRNLVIMHMNAGRSSMTKEDKARTSAQTPALRQAQCRWNVHPQLNAIPSNKVHMTYGI